MATLHLLAGNLSTGNRMLAEAYGLWKSLRPKDARPVEGLTEDDFDHLVGYWSR